MKKDLSELLNKDDPAWPEVAEMIKTSENPVEVLEPDIGARDANLIKMQVSTRSVLGAIAYETGGLLIDHGWLRILGSGHRKLPRSFSEWNDRWFEAEKNRPYCLVADDVIGGFWSMNIGGLGETMGELFYFAPDSLEWEATEIQYSQFIAWSMTAKLEQFYENFRWPGWQEEVQAVAGDQAFSIYPFLWAMGPPIGERSRKAVPITEVFQLNVREFPKQMFAQEL